MKSPSFILGRTAFDQIYYSQNTCIDTLIIRIIPSRIFGYTFSYCRFSGIILGQQAAIAKLAPAL